MNVEALQRARLGRKARHKVQEAFDAYLDHVVDRLVEKGLNDTVALEAIFSTIELLAENGTLPKFPEAVNYRMMGEWVVAAADFGFVDFMVEAVSE